MVKIFFLLLCTLLLPLHGFAAADTLQIGINGAYGSHEFNVSAGQTADYPGWAYGGTIGYVNRIQSVGYSSLNYGLGIFFQFNEVQKENAANTLSIKEKLSGYTMSVGPRIYALHLFFGAGLSYSNLLISTTVANVASRYSYSGIGYFLELGADIPLLGKNSAVTPRVFYENASLTQKENRSSNGMHQLGISLGLGYNF